MANRRGVIQRVHVGGRTVAGAGDGYVAEPGPVRRFFGVADDAESEQEPERRLVEALRMRTEEIMVAGDGEHRRRRLAQQVYQFCQRRIDDGRAVKQIAGLDDDVYLAVAGDVPALQELARQRLFEDVPAGHRVGSPPVNVTDDEGSKRLHSLVTSLMPCLRSMR